MACPPTLGLGESLQGTGAGGGGGRCGKMEAALSIVRRQDGCISWNNEADGGKMGKADSRGLDGER